MESFSSCMKVNFADLVFNVPFNHILLTVITLSIIFMESEQGFLFLFLNSFNDSLLLEGVLLFEFQILNAHNESVFRSYIVKVKLYHSTNRSLTL